MKLMYLTENKPIPFPRSDTSAIGITANPMWSVRLKLVKQTFNITSNLYFTLFFNLPKNNTLVLFVTSLFPTFYHHVFLLVIRF